MDVETHLNEDGTARLCTAPFSLVGKHVCSVQTTMTSTAPDTLGIKRPNKVNTVSPKQNEPPSAQQQQQQRTEDGDDISDHGGHTLIHDSASASKENKKYAKSRDTSLQQQGSSATILSAAQTAISVSNGVMDEDNDQMDVDVPDTEKDTQKAPADGSKQGGRKLRMVERAQILRGHTSPVFLCAWNPVPGSSVLATGAGDGTARIWDISRAKGDSSQSVTLRHDAPADKDEARLDVTSISWNPSGTLLATACFNGQLRVWSTSGELKLTLCHRPVPVISMRWNRKGSLLLSACLDGSICLWEVQTGNMRHEYKGHTGSVLDVDWLDNTTFASCAADKSIIVWRDEETSPVKTFTGHKSDVNSIKWHPGGKYIASASDDGTVKIWSMNSDTPVQDFFGHSQQVYTVKWLPRPDKAIVASASFDGTVRIWDVHSNACLRVLSAHTEAVHCLAFSSDGRYLASGSFDKKVRIWNVKDGSIFKTYNADDGIHDIQWAAKGKVAVAIANSQVAVFDPLSSSS
ncbi:hypothetical protein GGI26_004281 [Coemansia sp. RSA 1358]|nr:hypothetical protein GGI26_004281 [Coemansia sp. RSA 1358]